MGSILHNIIIAIAILSVHCGIEVWMAQYIVFCAANKWPGFVFKINEMPAADVFERQVKKLLSVLCPYAVKNPIAAVMITRFHIKLATGRQIAVADFTVN